MHRQFQKFVACVALASLAGCASTPMPQAFMNHFSSAKEDQEHSKCMADNAMFNNRQLMVAPGAVENAWSYCAKKSDVWYPGKDEGPNTTAVSWDVK